MRGWLRARLRPSGDEVGNLLVEVVIASTVLSIVVSMVFVSTGTMTRVTATDVRRGSLTGFAATGAAEVEQLLTNAWTPQNPNGVGVTDDCAGGSQGETFPVGQGPFVSASGTDVWFCSIRSGSHTAATYELHFTGCNVSGVCTLQADRQPAPGTTGAAVTVLAVDDVSCPACVGVAGAPSPFVFLDESTGAGTVLNPGGAMAAVAAAALHRIDTVDLTMTVTAAGTDGTTVTQTVALPNTAGGL